jgi:F-type H+-transporting ATPase subunit b
MLLATLLLAQEEAPPPLIDIDGTLLLQFVLFLLMLIVLSRFLFKPYLRIRDERAKGIEGAKHEAHDMEHRADKIVADYDARLTRTKQRGAEERARLRSEAAAFERQVLGAARDEGHRALEEARTRIGKEAQSAKARLEADAGALAKQMAKKILGREVA